MIPLPKMLPFYPAPHCPRQSSRTSGGSHVSPFVSAKPVKVFRVFFRRVLLILRGVVAGGDASGLCTRHGLHSFVDDLKPVGARLRRLVFHNLKVRIDLFDGYVLQMKKTNTLP